MIQNKQSGFESRRDAKWQFRRSLLLCVARLLDEQPEQVWPKITSNLSQRMGSPSESIRDATKRWVRFVGNSPETVSRTIQKHFQTDTPEGTRRHKLQDLSDGHPFSGILPDRVIKQLREDSKI